MTYVYKYERGIIFHRVVYVGITNNLARRHSEHLDEHPFFRSSRLFYIKVRSRAKAKKIESYLIRKWKPPLNRAEIDARPFAMMHFPFVWKRYK